MVEIESNFEFQSVIEKFIEKMGFQIVGTRLLDDGSIDFTAQTTNPMGGKVSSIIRASTYSRLVTSNDIGDLNHSMSAAGAVRAAYITTSGFSEDAVEEAKDKPISLINKYQLMDSLEKRGLLEDKELMAKLDRFGMAEQHFQGYEQSFTLGKSDEEAKAYFESKAKKGEKPAATSVRYAPVSVLKTVSLKDIWTEEQTLRSVEKKDYMFVNLNNLDLYYLLQKRKKNATESILLRSDIIKKIYTLPEESKSHLLNLLDFGDLPIEDLAGKELSILKNKGVIDIYEGRKFKSDLVGYAMMLQMGITETVNMVINEIVSGITTFGEGSEKPKVEEPPKKKVKAVVAMPHLNGGIYDIWKYMEVTKGLRQDAEIDALNYTSSDISKILKSVMKAKVKSEGIIFMPYFRTKYADSQGKVTKYEVLISPKFKGDEKKEVDTHKGGPKIKRKPIAGEYKLIK
jgi:hypothetical protein